MVLRAYWQRHFHRAPRIEAIYGDKYESYHIASTFRHTLGEYYFIMMKCMIQSCRNFNWSRVMNA